MSKVISFRLNLENPREAKAFAVLQNWLEQGFSARHTITDALLRLDLSNSQAAENRALNDLSHQINKFIENLEISTPLMILNSEISSKEKFSDGFATSIIKSAKPGLRIED